MISADRVLPLWLKYREALETPIRTFDFPKFGKKFEDRTYQMGVLNLSPDSSYRETVCHTLQAALYRGRRMTLEGAAMVDIGGESTGDTADIVSIERQIDRMRPAVSALADENILVSVETYHPEVAVALLEAGAGVVNLTGRVDDKSFYQAIAKHEAGLILCYTPGENARSSDDLPPVDQVFDAQLLFFKDRVAMAEDAGIERLWVDPGFGFALNLPDGPDRIRYQTDSILQSFRLRELGWPVTVQLTGHVFLFRDEVRVAQTSAATLAVLSKANMVRSHEVPRVQPVLHLQDYA
ncbi:dihydropteroate synthase [Roseibium alexandrii]|uniref:Dihydropteroate synthase/related enzyme n=1 Tax=Roseibium alexandrii (strain DSM 17067 / NCIMB 14079 / DFL-11) TaxID=244592 RepID=A0A5E8H260_ROSAD|nr:dihydropteroate synthase [Roseibium alexandrii]EEE45919.1 Dihydropteroate synthase/related enzyme [Roseibium alexandrii DFL-11]